MLNTSKIEELRNKSGLSQIEFGKKIGLTKNGYKAAIDRNDFKVSVLQSIANFFNIKISYFFDEYEESAMPDKKNRTSEPRAFYGNKDDVKELRERVAELKQALADKQEIIVMLKKEINYNMNAGKQK